MEWPIVARFERVADARECSLVLAAKGIGYSIERQDPEWVLVVAPDRFKESLEELRAYIVENEGRGRAPEPEAPRPKMWSLFVVAWIVLLFGVLQAEKGADWTERGIMSSEKVLKAGEWWRVITALTLHGDVHHILANLTSGVLFAGLLMIRFGQGVTWLLILLAGGFGNFFNAVIYINVEHLSLGASTAVFGALGLLSGSGFSEVFIRGKGVTWWRWVLPLGAGLSLLATLGTGGNFPKQVDVLAHFWGFSVGFPIGALSGWLFERPRPGPLTQSLSAVCAVILLAGSWFAAFSFGKAP